MESQSRYNVVFKIRHGTDLQFESVLVYLGNNLITKLFLISFHDRKYCINSMGRIVTVALSFNL